MDYILKIHNITKTYPDFKLDSISMDMSAGKIVGLIGENGAGKTTLIRTILNQIERDSGTIEVFGLDNRDNEIDIKKNIGFVIDECCFHPCLSSKNINKILKHIYIQWNDEYFFDTLLKFNIGINKKVKDMSKGMKTKLMFAAALSHSPKLLILDEVTSGLDPIVRDDILTLLKQYVIENNASVFFSTHITSDLDKAADDIAFLHNGMLIFFEPIKSIRQKYVLIKCSVPEYNSIEKDSIIASYYSEGEHRVLIDSTQKHDLYIGESSIPTLDDIMLLQIKGEKNDRTN